MTPTELWLPIGAVAFYLYDSLGLLWQNEMLFTRSASRWQTLGGSELRLGGRRVVLPNPLLPQRPQFLVRWSLADARADASETDPLQRLLPALRFIGVVNVLQLMLLLLALPLTAWTLGAGLVMLIVFALFYLLTLLNLALVWRRRDALHLSTRNLWTLALDVLACAPFAVNLTRKISQRHGIEGDPLRFAARYFDTDARAQMKNLLAARLQEEDATANAGTPRPERLATMLMRLES